MAIRVDLKSGVAHIQVFGYATWDDFRRAFTTMIEHPDFRPGLDALWDIRFADLTQFTTPELLRFVEFVNEHAPDRGGARGALVLPPPVDHGLSPMYEAVRDLELPVHMKVFENLAEAESWLASSKPVA